MATPSMSLREELPYTFNFVGRPGLPKLHFSDVKMNHTRFLVTWDSPDDNGGAKVDMFTLWYRTVSLMNNTQHKWSTLNVTHNSFSLKLNCCLTYEIMVTAWNRNGPSFTDPDNAARIAVLRGIHVCTALQKFVHACYFGSKTTMN